MPEASPRRLPATCVSRCAAGLALLFCVGLIGRMPFWMAAAVFVTAFIALFEWRAGRALGPAVTAARHGAAAGRRHRHRGHAGVREDLLRAPSLTVAGDARRPGTARRRALGGFMSPGILFTVLWATFLGIVIGALPGLTATMGVALMTTLTFTMPHTQAILVLVCIYVGAIYGGSRSAILLNIPGHARLAPARRSTAIRWRARDWPAAPWAYPPPARGSARCSASLCVALFTPILSEMALTFQSFEFFWIARLRHRHRRHAGRRRPAQGLHRRLPRPVDRHHRPGAPLQLSALRVRQHRPCRRHRPAAGAGRRLRRGRGAAGHARAGGQGRLLQASTRSIPRIARRHRSTGARSCARAPSAPSSASCRGSARTRPPGRPMPRRGAPARSRRSTARARSRV